MSFVQGTLFLVCTHRYGIILPTPTLVDHYRSLKNYEEYSENSPQVNAVESVIKTKGLTGCNELAVLGLRDGGVQSAH